MKNKLKLAFEISDNHAQHAHMISLFNECLNDESILVSVYTNKESNVDDFYDLYFKIYKSNCFEQVSIKIVTDSLINRCKRKLVFLINKFKLSWIIPFIRKIFLKIKSAKTTEDYSSFYKNNASFFLQQDMLLTTELKGSYSILSSPVKLVWLLHGIVSNDNPYFKNWGCHLVVSPQVGLQEKLLQKVNLSKDTVFYHNAYLKKDVIEHGKVKDKLFANDNKIFVYNPHWDNGLNQSSWFQHGVEILEFFKINKEYNLIFAPHILLDKFYQIKISEEYTGLENIIIDTKSPQLINGTYIGYADYYIGDVSSQFFEFALCNKNLKSIFINASGMQWKSNPIYSYWETGIVINDVEELSTAIEHASLNSSDFSKFFYEIPSNQAKKLLEFLKSQF